MKKCLFVIHDLCVGCKACEVACQKEHGWTHEEFGIRVFQDGPRANPDGSWEYTYFPLPTSQCDLCEERVGKGKLPTCVHHCFAGCMKYGTVEELAPFVDAYPRSSIISPN